MSKSQREPWTTDPSVNVASKGRENFDAAMKIAWRHERTKATHYRIDEEYGLVLCNSEGMHNAQPLPYPMDLAAATEFAWNWLRDAAYAREPDHDGSNAHGFRVYNEAWGHVAAEWRAFVAIKPTWIMYGK